MYGITKDTFIALQTPVRGAQVLWLVCLCISLSVSSSGYLWNNTFDLCPIFCGCCLWPWIGPPLAGWWNPKGEGQFWWFSSPLTMHCTAQHLGLIQSTRACISDLSSLTSDNIQASVKKMNCTNEHFTADPWRNPHLQFFTCEWLIMHHQQYNNNNTKRLNWSRCCLGWWVGLAEEQRVTWGWWSPKGQFLGENICPTSLIPLIIANWTGPCSRTRQGQMLDCKCCMSLLSSVKWVVQLHSVGKVWYIWLPCFNVQTLTNTQNIPLVDSWARRILAALYSTVYWV